MRVAVTMIYEVDAPDFEEAKERVIRFVNDQLSAAGEPRSEDVEFVEEFVSGIHAVPLSSFEGALPPPHEPLPAVADGEEFPTLPAPEPAPDPLMSIGQKMKADEITRNDPALDPGTWTVDGSEQGELLTESALHDVLLEGANEIRVGNGGPWFAVNRILGKQVRQLGAEPRRGFAGS